MSKTGFSTLNRWLGRKNKDKSLSNGKLSKSNTNLSISSTNLNDSSQSLEYNRITPLPIVTSNAPFEQTFRITVLLPKDQLYVARLGARVPLSKLLELICDNKQLDRNKYEFRNPVDPSQVYNCELTIGAVGLSEIRLCHKNESYDTFNGDEILKLQRTSITRDSLSSSEFSSRFSKHTNKTTSPYSSTNSLNSMDSSGLNYTRTPFLITTSNVHQHQHQHPQHHIYASNTHNGNTFIKPVKMIAPPRKKRTAPRPPSQISIPEKGVLITSNGVRSTCQETPENAIYNGGLNSLRVLSSDRCVSTPNLTTSVASVNPQQNSLHYSQAMSDSGRHSIDYRTTCDGGSSTISVNGYADDTVVYAQVQKKNAQNLLDSQSKDAGQLNSNGIDKVDVSMCKNDIEKEEEEDEEESISAAVPEPTPRKRSIVTKKKSAPAPPPRHSICLSDSSEDVLSTQTFSSESSGTLHYNGGDYATVQELEQQQQHEKLNSIPMPKTRHINDTTSMRNGIDVHDAEPKPIPRVNGGTSSTLLNSQPMESIDLEVEKYAQRGRGCGSVPNVSKTMLNCSPTPEHPIHEVDEMECMPPSSTSLRTSPDSDSCYDSHLERLKQSAVDDDNASKQADSGIGEPGGPSPLPDSLPVSEVSATDCKSNFESSSDDDDLIKVYNFKLGKTMVKQLNDTQNADDLLTVVRSVETSTVVVPSTNKIELALSDSSQDVGVSNHSTTTTTTTTTKSTSKTTITTINASMESIKSPSSTEVKNWNFGVPISPPPTFADGNKSTSTTSTVVTSIASTLATTKTTTTTATTATNVYGRRESTPDTPITPKITERPILDFAALQKDEECQQKSMRGGAIIDSKMFSDISPMSPTTPLNGLVEELSLIINGKGVDSLIRKPRENQQIEAATANTLQNFTITTAMTKNNSDDAVETNDEDKLYRKQGTTNIHILHNGMNGNGKQSRRRSVNRADSFHSMVVSDSNDDLNVVSVRANHLDGNGNRSSSQLSLTKLGVGQTNGEIDSPMTMQRRCSSSELSIRESPSLQSLEVIKTILNNNRHNSLEAAKENRDVNRKKESLRSRREDGDEVDELLVVNARRPSSELQFTSLELKPKISQIQTQKDQEKAPSAPSLPPATAPKPANKRNVPKIYRYSGPPSINVGTWNERPRMQVAIKNEGDYIFGGKGATTQAPGAIASLAMSNGRPMMNLTGNRSNQMQSLPDNYKSDGNGELIAPSRKSLSGRIDIVTRMGIPEREFKVPIMVRPLQDVVVESPSDMQKGTDQEDVSLDAERCTLPRSLKKWRPQNEVGSGSGSGSCTLQRPVSMIQTNGRGSENVKATMTAPFGQNTLRRTGLKEEILAAETNGSTSITNGDLEVTAKRATLNFPLKKQISATSSMPPPPPPMAQLKRTMVKSAPATPSPEPRDQLLEAIRSFDRSQLKRK